MITRQKFASFVKRVASQTSSEDEWNQLAVAHYGDDKIEDARIRLVQIVIDYDSTNKRDSQQFMHDLNAIAESLEQKF